MLPSSHEPSRTSAPRTELLRRALGLKEEESPFPWQVELLRRFCAGESVSSLDIPTGLGKTGVMAVWVVARALGAGVPRRLVYIVDRRAVVDQATEVAESLRDWVTKEPGVAEGLGVCDRGLAISTLRGQHVDNRAWLEDPSAPAIVVGTVDLIGSRLLFSGYGVSSKMRSYHAGLMGADTLVVLDEAHLVPPFEHLLRQIEEGIGTYGPDQDELRKQLPPFRLLSLSATGRQNDASSLRLGEQDRADPIVSKRLNSKKSLRVVDIADLGESGGANAKATAIDSAGAPKKSKGAKLAGVLAGEAWEVTAQGSAPVRCIVFCDKRVDAEAVADELRGKATPDTPVELFVGGRRVKERVQARDDLAKHGFIAGTHVKLERSAFLIATSAGEVGVDLDADHMVCDLVAWERMVQRLGRVNRRGDGDATIVVVVDNEPPVDDKTVKAIEKRDASREAKARRDDLAREVSALTESKAALPKGQKKSDQDKASDEKRKQLEKELKKRFSDCKRAITAFKDNDAKLVATHETAVRKHRALRELLTAVGENGSLSPAALLTLRGRQDLADAHRHAISDLPIRPELTRPLVDAWSMTSLEEHPGRPEIGPWLRGFKNEEPQTTLVWRRHLPVPDDRPFEAKAAKRFFEAAPPHASEQLEIETYRAFDWLKERVTEVLKARDAERSLHKDHVVLIALGARGELKGWQTLDQLAAALNKRPNENKEAKKERDRAESDLKALLVSATVVLDARLGGLTAGLLAPKTNAPAEAADDGSTTWLAHPDVANAPLTGFLIQALGTTEDGAPAWSSAAGTGWVRRHVFVTSRVDGEPSAALVIDGWEGEATMEDERAEAGRPQRLDEHQSWAEDCARKLAERLGLEPRMAKLLAMAARLHDEGKRASNWQRAFKAPIEGRPYAKTRGPIDFNTLDGYRHELGSLPYVEADAEFKALAADDQDFVLHLVAAHHGFARPVIGTRGCEDAPPSVIDDRAFAVAIRFARLSKRWGPWGLAWWEALLRAADQQASRRNQKEAAAKKETA